MAFVIKAQVTDQHARRFSFTAQKTMYGGKQIASGDTVFIFASENEGGSGLLAVGTVAAASPVARVPGVQRQTPRVNVVIERTRTAARRLGRGELKPWSTWNDGRPETELNFKLYRQATNKVVGITDEAAAFLHEHF